MTTPSRYRLEWPSAATLADADSWSVHVGVDDARRTALRLLIRKRRRVPWVRVVMLGAGGDAADRFVTATDLAGWTGELPPSLADGVSPVAPPEIDRLRERALSALDVVLGWSRRRGLLTRVAADEVRLVFEAAMLGIVSHRGS